MKKTFLSSPLLRGALMASLLAPVCAADFGGMVTNNSLFSGQDTANLKSDQTNTASFWIRTPFSNDNSTYFTAEGLYQYENDRNYSTITHAFDIDLFKFGWSESTGSHAVSIAAGRFAVSDLTGLIFNQSGDGLFIRAENSRFQLSAYGGYTGLLNAQTVTILAPEQDPFSYDYNAVYQYAAKYVVGSLTGSLPYVFLNQTVSAQFLGTFRLENAAYNRLYATLNLNGPLHSSLFYTLTSTIGMTSYNGNSYDLSNLSCASVSWYLPFKSASVSLNGVYASGEQGPFKRFVGFTSETATDALSEPEYTEMARTGITATIKPVTKLLLSAEFDTVFDASDSITYQGFQYQTSAGWQLLSDIFIGGQFYQYYDQTNTDENKSCFGLKAAITF